MATKATKINQMLRSSSWIYWRLAPILTTRSRAFQRLAGLWSVSFEEPTLDPYCRLLNDSGLACLDVSNWSELVVFNRPSIVVLSADETLHRAIVQSVVGQNVNLLIGEREILVDRATFESVWTGSAVGSLAL